MSRGFSGPKANEVRGALGVDPNITSEVVLTGTQACEKPGKHWVDKPNAGYSGTPMWKLALERSQQEEESRKAAPTVKIPEGFKLTEKGSCWYFSEKKGLYFNSQDGKQYLWDAHSQERVPLYEARTYELRVAVGSCFHERASQVRHVLVRDLMKAGQALRMSLEHLDRPCALYALYEGHRGQQQGQGTGNTCAEYCVKHLHSKLLPKLSAFRGYWEDERLASAMRDSFQELDDEFGEKNAGSKDGCSAAVGLITGNRLIVASLGDVACVLCMRSGESVEMLKPHAVPDSDDEDEDDEDEPNAATSSTAAAGGEKPPIRWTRAFGDLDYKAPGSSPRLLATADVKVLNLESKHHGFSFICRSLYNCIGKSVAVSTVFRRSAGRARMASGAMVDAAVQYLGQVGDHGLGSIVVFFDRIESADAPPQKRARKEDPSQVRLRHILLKHRECKSTVDKVRNKQVKRTRGEAERLLRAVLEECEADVERKKFSQRCKEMSECQSCLKAGELIGDLGWVKPGKFGQAFDDTAFALSVGQMSDLVDTDQGVHIIMRTA